MVFSVFSGGIKERKEVLECRPTQENLDFASGVRNPGLWNPYNDWNPESKFHWQGIRNPVSRIPNPESRIQDCCRLDFRCSVGGGGDCGLIFRIAACNRALGGFPLFRTDRPDHSRQISQILNSMHQRRSWFFSKNSWKKPNSLLNLLFRQWSGRPVLINGKCPKNIASLDSLTYRVRWIWILKWVLVSRNGLDK